MQTEHSLDKHKEEVAILLRRLVEMREERREKLNIGLMNRWAHTLENEVFPPVIQDELYHVYRDLSAMAKAGRFSSNEAGVVHSILKLCGLYDDIEKLWD